MPTRFKQCPNCGNVSFYWDAEETSGMVFFRVLADGGLTRNQPPHDLLPEPLAQRIRAGDVFCMGCSWHGALPELH